MTRNTAREIAAHLSYELSFTDKTVEELLQERLTSEAFAAFLQARGVTDFYIAGADAAVCIKSTCYNMAKCGYTVHVLSDCITSYDKKNLPEMLTYYESKGCSVGPLQDIMQT